MPPDYYVATGAYHATLDRIIGAFADPGLCIRTDLIEILGDLGIWPASCRPENPALQIVVTGDQRSQTPVASVISVAHAMAA